MVALEKGKTISQYKGLEISLFTELLLHVEKGNLTVCKESYQMKPQLRIFKGNDKCVVIANLALFLLLAIKFYRRAMQLVPDIEFKITYTRSPDGDGVGNS